MDQSLDSRASIRSWLVGQLADLLGEPLDEVASLSDDDDLLGYGLDSIRLMYLQERLRAQGVVVTFADLSGRASLGAWLDLMPHVPRRDIAVVEGPWSAVADGSVAHERNAPFELSSVQQAYWLGRSAGEVLGNVACHAFLEFRCRNMDPLRLGAAAEQVRKRHPMLRARFVNGRQQVLERAEVPCFDHQDWRSLDATDAERAWDDLWRYRSHECLAVEDGQVFIVGVARMPGGEDRVWLSLDLLAADVESLRLLLGDLGAAYTAPEGMVEAPSFHFADYLARREGQRAASRDRARGYWLERLSALPDAPRLPLAVAPDQIREPRWRRRSFVLTGDESRRLDVLASAHGVTLSSVFGCAFATILARWSETPEFLLNVPLFDRHDADPRIAEVIADFTTLLLLDCRVDLNSGFDEAVKAFQRALHGAIDHAAFPALEVLREARRQGHPRSAPVVFSSNLNEGGFIPDSFRSVFGELHDMLSQTPQVWLDHQLYRVEGGILVAWDSVQELFSEAMLDDMFGAYVGLLQRLCDGDWASSLTVPLPWHQGARRSQRNALPAVGRARCLHHDFFERAERDPSATALWHGEGRLSFGDLADWALRIAAGLRDLGIGVGDAVEISLPRGPHQIAAVFGVLAAGACYVPLDIDHPPLRRHLIETSAGIRLAIAETGDPQADPPRSSVRDLLATVPLGAPLRVAPQASAYVIYTSGSTGLPKGVEVSHAAAMNTIDAVLDLLEVTPDDRLLAISALDFDLSVFDLFGGLGAGASLVVPGQDQARDAAAWAESVVRQGVTLWNSAPALLEMALSLPADQADYRSLRGVLLSGDWVALDLPERLRTRSALGCRLHVLGGATEAGIWSNWQTVDAVPPHWRSIPYGRPLPGQAYRVVDDRGRDVPDHVVGELWIGGASLARGYRNDPVLTARRFVHDGQGRWYRTGDRGCFWSDGTIEFLGRIDQQVKVRGQRIELGEIETALCQEPMVEGACAAVFGEASPGLGAALVVRAPERCDPTRDLPAVAPFAGLDEAEVVVTRRLLARLLDAPLHLEEGLHLRWLDWLAGPAAMSTGDLAQALAHLGWSDATLEFMSRALEGHLSGERDRAEVLLDPWLAPQAMAARLPDGQAALARLLDALPAPEGDGPIRVAVLDARAAFWLEQGLSERACPGVAFTLFDRSRALLDLAADRLPGDVRTQVLDGGLLPSADWGQFDRVISFASLHTYPTSGEGLAVARTLLRPDGRLLLVDVMRDSPLSLVNVALLGEDTPRLRDLPGLMEDFAAAGLEARCLWRSERFALIDARSTGPVLDVEGLRAGLTARLPQAMRPDSLWCLPRLPLNANGKVDRRQLAESMGRMAVLGDDCETGPEGPLNKREMALAECWEAVLKRPVRERSVSFFRLGGDSLLATRLLSILRDRFGVRLGMADFYRQPTLEGLAGWIGDRVDQSADSHETPVEEGVL
jgi:dihydroaeruginoic acid synthetase